LAFVLRREEAMLEIAKPVVVAPLCPMEKTVVEALVTASKREPEPQVVSRPYGVVVPIPTPNEVKDVTIPGFA
jgi:hypothetical protein